MNILQTITIWLTITLVVSNVFFISWMYMIVMNKLERKNS